MFSSSEMDEDKKQTNKKARLSFLSLCAGLNRKLLICLKRARKIFLSLEGDNDKVGNEMCLAKRIVQAGFLLWFC